MVLNTFAVCSSNNPDAESNSSLTKPSCVSFFSRELTAATSCRTKRTQKLNLMTTIYLSIPINKCLVFFSSHQRTTPPKRTTLQSFYTKKHKKTQFSISTTNPVQFLSRTQELCKTHKGFLIKIKFSESKHN